MAQGHERGAPGREERQEALIRPDAGTLSSHLDYLSPGGSKCFDVLFSGASLIIRDNASPQNTLFSTNLTSVGWLTSDWNWVQIGTDEVNGRAVIHINNTLAVDYSNAAIN